MILIVYVLLSPVGNRFACSSHRRAAADRIGCCPDALAEEEHQ